MASHQAIQPKDAPEWMIVMFYLMPGLCGAGLLTVFTIVAFPLHYSGVKNLTTPIVIFTFIHFAITYGIGVRRAQFKRNTMHQPKETQNKQFWREAEIFFAWQLLCAPAVASAIYFACITVFF